MNDIPDSARLGRCDDIFGRGDVVVDERLFVQCTDLGMVQNQRARARESLLPCSWFREIGFDDVNARI